MPYYTFKRGFAMKITGIVLGVFLSCCVGNVYTTDIYTDLFTLQPSFPQQGEELTIYYNTHHGDSRFTNESDLFVTVNVVSKDSVYMLRMPMEYLRSGDSVCAVSLKVPDDAVYLYFLVGKKDNTTFVSDMNIPVFCDTNIVQGAAAYHILNCRSYEEAKRVFDIDKALYPESYERNAPLWNGMLDADIASKAILKKADSLYEALSSLECMDRGQIDLSIACIIAYQRSGQYDKLNVLLRLVSESVINRKVKFGAFQEIMLGGVGSKMLDAYCTDKACSKSELITFIGAVCDICIARRSMRPLVNLFMHSKPSFNKRSKEIRGIIKAHPVWEFIKNLAFDMSENEFMNGGVVLHMVLDDCYTHGEYRYCIDAATALNPRLDACLEWTRKNRYGVVSLTPGYGMESLIRLLQAKSYFQLGDTVNAVKLYSWMASRDPNKPYYQWALFESARALTHHYAEIGNRDSSAKYIGLLYSTAAPKTDETYDQAKKSYGAEYYTEEEIISKYYRPSYYKKKSAPEAKIKNINGTNIDVGKNCNGLLLVLTTRGCGICRVVVPPLIEQFARDNVVDNIIVMTDEMDYPWAPSTIGKTIDNIGYANMDDGLISKLDVPGYPCCFYFKKGDILISGGVNDLIYKQTRRALEEYSRAE